MTTTPPPIAPAALAPAKPKNSFARVAFIIAIAAFVLGCISFAGFISWVPAGIAVILAIIALTRPNLPKKMAVAALIVGIIAVLAGPVTAITNVIAAASGTTNATPLSIASSAPAATDDDNAPAATTPAEEPSEAPAEDTTVKTKTYTGNGDKVVKVEYDVPVIVSFSCSNCSGNTAVKTDSGTNTLIVNTIGGYSGRHILNTGDGDLLTRFVISADSAWKLKIVDAQNAKIERVSVGSTLKGKGDDVIAVEEGVTDSDVRAIGQGNFALKSYGGSDSLPVNDIGSYKGNVVLDGPAIVQVNADGTWSIKGNG